MSLVHFGSSFVGLFFVMVCFDILFTHMSLEFAVYLSVHQCVCVCVWLSVCLATAAAAAVAAGRKCIYHKTVAVYLSHGAH